MANEQNDGRNPPKLDRVNVGDAITFSEQEEGITEESAAHPVFPGMTYKGKVVVGQVVEYC